MLSVLLPVPPVVRVGGSAAESGGRGTDKNNSQEVRQAPPQPPTGHTPTTPLPCSDNTPTTYTHRTHTHTHTHTATTTYPTLRDVMLGQCCATDSIDLSVNFPQYLCVVRGAVAREAV